MFINTPEYEIIGINALSERFAMRKSCILLGICLFLGLASVAVAAEQLDIEAIRQDIERYGWSFEVDDAFSRSLTPEQRQNLRGYRPPADYQKILDENLKIFPVDKDLPSSLDWRDVNGVTSVKNQGDCGSCWAFAATAELESFIKIYYGEDTNLSEQQVVSCNPYGADCDGGWANAAYFVFRQYGAAQENCMPYLGMSPPDAPCEQDEFKKYGFITGWHSISNNVQQIKEALQDGPVCTAIDASDEFEAYDSGCYDVPGGWTNHLVLIVGYDDRACGNNGAWIIKNSWGYDFGDGGYIYVQYGAGSTGQSVTQLEYTPPPTSISIHTGITEEPLIGDGTALIEWSTSGAAAPLVDIYFGNEGHCHQVLVAENLPNTGSYNWAVPNLGTNYGSLVVYPSSGTEDGFGITEDYIKVVGHKTRYVSPSGSNTAPFETPETAAHSISDAVVACTGTDSVLVAGGHYLGTVTVGTTVRLIGGFSEDFTVRDLETYPTVIQSGNTGMRFLEGSGDFGMVDGFVFRDCTGSPGSVPESGSHGGGIFVRNASPLILDCVFEDNLASASSGTGFGGAICVVGGQPEIRDCVFRDNVGSQGGALGIFDGAHPTLIDCQILGNACRDSSSANTGAGLFVRNAAVTVQGGALGGNGGGAGAGMHLLDAQGYLSRVDIRNNRAQVDGGGILAVDSTLDLANVKVTGNVSNTGSGGGLSSQGTSFTLRNVQITDNRSAILGGGMFASGATGLVENCLTSGNTAGNTGGLMALASGPMIVRNNIVSENFGGGLTVIGSEVTIGCNNVWQNDGGDYVSMTAPASDFSADPLFLNAAADDFGLGQYSPCVDRGEMAADCLDPDGSRADVGLLGGPGADFVAPDHVTGADLEDLGGGTWRLTWNALGADNISHYVVYRDTTEVFVPSPMKALATIDHPGTVFEDAPGMECYYLVAAVDEMGYSGGYSAQVSTAGSISAAGGSELPRNLAIAKVVPNPFNPRTTLSYEVPRTGRIELAVYDIKGRLVKRLVSGTVQAGRHTVSWSGQDSHGRAVAAGVYFARMSDGRTATTSKMVLTK